MVPVPSDCFLHDLESLGAPHGRKRWRSYDGKRLYEWDSQHGEVEVYTKRGFHIFVADPVSGSPIKPAVEGRRIDV